MTQSLTFLVTLLLIGGHYYQVSGQTVATCWNPAMGTQLTCVANANAYCQTNLTSGVGSCQAAICTDPTTICCNSGANCNQIVTQCYNPVARSFVACDQTGLSTYCQVKR